MPDEVQESTEDAILSSIGEVDDTATDTTASEQTQEATNDTTNAATTTNEATTTDQATSSSDGIKPNTQQGNNPQDLKLNDGTIIKGGAERRLFDKGVKLQGQNTTLTNQLAEATAKLTALEGTNTLGTQYNLSAEELTWGAQLAAAYKSDPVATMKHLLTQTQSAGHNIEDVGGSAVDMNSIKKMVEDAVKPMTDRFNSEQEATDRQIEATKLWTDFQTANPDATVHTDSIAQLLREDPTLSLSAAYYKLQSMYHQRGLDWSKPLEQLRNEAAARENATNTNPNEQISTIPSGGNTGSNNLSDNSGAVAVDTPLDDIIKSSMKEAGYAT